MRLNAPAATKRNILIAAIFCLLTSPAAAQTCTVTSSPLAFTGYLGTVAASQDVTARITVTCAISLGIATVDYSIAPGDDGSGGRDMAGLTAQLLDYQLYTDTNGTTAWTAALPITGSLLVVPALPTVVNIIIHGRIIPNQITVPAGNYTATVPIELSYQPSG